MNAQRVIMKIQEFVHHVQEIVEFVTVQIVKIVIVDISYNQMELVMMNVMKIFMKILMEI